MPSVLPGIPTIESPLFEMELPMLRLSGDEERIARSLNTSGFAVFDFPDPEIDARIDRIKHNLAPRFDIDFADDEADKTCAERRVQDAWMFDEDVRAIATNTAMLDLLGKVYGRPAFPFQTLNFPVGTQQEQHSDAVHFSSLPERFMCGVWLAMEDISNENGPLFYVPASHKWPIMTNGLIGRSGYRCTLESAQDPYGPAWEALVTAHGGKPETFLARKGQALIWCANLLHGGSRQIDPTLTRWSQVTHYYFDRCIYYTPAFSDEYVGRLQVRSPRSITDGNHKFSQFNGEVIQTEPDPGLLSIIARNFLGKTKAKIRLDQT